MRSEEEEKTMKTEIKIDRWQDLRVGDEIECGNNEFRVFAMDAGEDTEKPVRLDAVCSGFYDPGWLTGTIINSLIATGTVKREEVSANPLAKLILSHGDENDGTSWPYWAICQKGGLGNIVLIQGIWFSREGAQAHLNARLYEYGQSAFVYCFSGYHSDHVRRLYELAGSRGHS